MEYIQYLYSENLHNKLIMLPSMPMDMLWYIYESQLTLKVIPG